VHSFSPLKAIVVLFMRTKEQQESRDKTKQATRPGTTSDRANKKRATGQEEKMSNLTSKKEAIELKKSIRRGC
jgi:hypothetical protein